MRRFVAPEPCEVGAASGIHVFDVFWLRLGIGLGNFEHSKMYSKMNLWFHSLIAVL